MKSLARLDVWWPDIDSVIETNAKSCAGCATAGRNPVRVPLHQWELPLCTPRLCWTIQKKMLLLLTDSFNNWPEVMKMTDTSATATISKLKQIFATQGLPEQIMLDDGPQFIASEFFKECCSSCGILHTTTAPYHPPRSRKTCDIFKSSVKKANPTLFKRGSSKIVLPIFLLDIELPLI